MSLYRVIFKREQIDNPLTGSARYRVIDCYRTVPPSKKVKEFTNDLGFGQNPEKAWGVLLGSPRRIGTIINPKSALFH